MNLSEPTEPLLEIMYRCVAAARVAVQGIASSEPLFPGSDHYPADMAANSSVVGILLSEGIGVLSEESGVHPGDGALVAVVDPLDGTVNSSRGLPWSSTSICILDDGEPIAAVVSNLATGTVYTAVRGAGAYCDGRQMSASKEVCPMRAVLCLSSGSPLVPGFSHYRMMGSAALDLCSVASGGFDCYLDRSARGHAPWDYLAGVLICREAGGVVAELENKSLVATSHFDRRRPVAAGSELLLEQLLKIARSPGTLREASRYSLKATCEGA